MGDLRLSRAATEPRACAAQLAPALDHPGNLAGLLICLGFSSTLAAYASGGAMNVLAGLMSFAICTLLFAVFTVVTAGPARIWRNAIFWQAGWIVFVLVASWLGHLAITARWGR